MKIFELLSEQTISSTGSTTGTPAPVQSVSQTPPRTTPPPQGSTQQTQDPQTQQLAALLKQKKVIDNETDMNNFMSAYTASSQQKALNPDQQEVMSKLAGPLMTDPSLAAKLKMLSAKKPGM